jgi:hypothetical protein
MVKKSALEYHFAPETLREFLKPIKRENLLELLNQWGIENLDPNLNKLELFLTEVGTNLTRRQMEDLWLVREKILTFRTRSWIVFAYQGDARNFTEIQTFKQKCLDFLVNHRLEFNNSIEILKMNHHFYISLVYRGPFRLFEQDIFQFGVIQPIQRTRCLINLKRGIIRINSRSSSKMQLVLAMLEEVLGIKLKKIPIPAYKISDFVKSEGPIKKLTVTCPRTVGGFEGIEKITVEGSDVVQGLYNLQSRQEIQFSYQGLQKLGPWTAAKSDNARITYRGEVQVDDENPEEILTQLIAD